MTETTSRQVESEREGLKHFGLEPVGTHLQVNFSAEVTGYGEIGGRLFYQLSTDDATYDIFPEQTRRSIEPAAALLAECAEVMEAHLSVLPSWHLLSDEARGKQTAELNALLERMGRVENG